MNKETVVPSLNSAFKNPTESQIIARLRALNTDHNKAVKPFAKIRLGIGESLFQLRKLRKSRKIGPSFSNYVNEKLRKDTGLCSATGWNYLRGYSRVHRIFGKFDDHLKTVLDAGIDIMSADVIREFANTDIRAMQPATLVNWYNERPVPESPSRKAPKALNPEQRQEKAVKALLFIYRKSPADVLAAELERVTEKVLAALGDERADAAVLMRAA